MNTDHYQQGGALTVYRAVPILERYSWEPITMALALDGRACRQRLERQAR